MSAPQPDVLNPDRDGLLCQVKAIQERVSQARRYFESFKSSKALRKERDDKLEPASRKGPKPWPRALSETSQVTDEDSNAGPHMTKHSNGVKEPKKLHVTVDKDEKTPENSRDAYFNQLCFDVISIFGRGRVTEALQALPAGTTKPVSIQLSTSVVDDLAASKTAVTDKIAPPSIELEKDIVQEPTPVDEPMEASKGLTAPPVDTIEPSKDQAESTKDAMGPKDQSASVEDLTEPIQDETESAKDQTQSAKEPNLSNLFTTPAPRSKRHRQGFGYYNVPKRFKEMGYFGPEDAPVEHTKTEIIQTQITQTQITQTHITQTERSHPHEIEFDDVFQDGNAKVKHLIVPFSNEWYVIYCKTHKFYPVGKKPLAAAAKHMHSPVHGIMDRGLQAALYHFGMRVLNCNEVLAEKNNESVRAAYARGYRPHKRTRRKPHPNPLMSVDQDAPGEELHEEHTADNEVSQEVHGEVETSKPIVMETATLISTESTQPYQPDPPTVSDELADTEMGGQEDAEEFDVPHKQESPEEATSIAFDFTFSDRLGRHNDLDDARSSVTIRKSPTNESKPHKKRRKRKSSVSSDWVPSHRTPDVEEKANSRAGRSRRRGQGITDPTPGCVYYGFWNNFWLGGVLILPGIFTNDSIDLGFDISLDDLHLNDEIPSCFVKDPKTGILNWKDDYKDGGSLVHMRQFPVMFFDDTEVLSECEVGWVKAQDLLPLPDPKSKQFKDTRYSDLVLTYLKFQEGRGVAGAGLGIGGLETKRIPAELDTPSVATSVDESSSAQESQDEKAIPLTDSSREASISSDHKVSLLARNERSAGAKRATASDISSKSNASAEDQHQETALISDDESSELSDVDSDDLLTPDRLDSPTIASTAQDSPVFTALEIPAPAAKESTESTKKDAPVPAVEKVSTSSAKEATREELDSTPEKVGDPIVQKPPTTAAAAPNIPASNTAPSAKEMTQGSLGSKPREVPDPVVQRPNAAAAPKISTSTTTSHTPSISPVITPKVSNSTPCEVPASSTRENTASTVSSTPSTTPRIPVSTVSEPPAPSLRKLAPSPVRMAKVAPTPNTSASTKLSTLPAREAPTSPVKKTAPSILRAPAPTGPRNRASTTSKLPDPTPKAFATFVPPSAASPRKANIVRDSLGIARGRQDTHKSPQHPRKAVTIVVEDNDKVPDGRGKGQSSYISPSLPTPPLSAQIPDEVRVSRLQRKRKFDAKEIQSAALQAAEKRTEAKRRPDSMHRSHRSEDLSLFYKQRPLAAKGISKDEHFLPMKPQHGLTLSSVRQTRPEPPAPQRFDTSSPTSVPSSPAGFQLPRLNAGQPSFQQSFSPRWATGSAPQNPPRKPVVSLPSINSLFGSSMDKPPAKPYSNSPPSDYPTPRSWSAVGPAPRIQEEERRPFATGSAPQPRGYRCRHCDKMFDNSTRLYDHWATTHPEVLPT